MGEVGGGGFQMRKCRIIVPHIVPQTSAVVCLLLVANEPRRSIRAGVPSYASRRVCLWSCEEDCLADGAFGFTAVAVRESSLMHERSYRPSFGPPGSAGWCDLA